MTPSPAAENLTKGFEKCELVAYMPTVHDRPTIGWGCAGPDIHLGMVWTQEQCDARFTRDYDDFALSVSACVDGWAPTSQSQFDAFTDFAYNEGAHALHGSTMLLLHRQGNYEAAANEFGKWDTQAHIVLNGLVRRRASDEAMYRGLA